MLKQIKSFSKTLLLFAVFLKKKKIEISSKELRISFEQLKIFEIYTTWQGHHFTFTSKPPTFDPLVLEVLHIAQNHFQNVHFKTGKITYHVNVAYLSGEHIKKKHNSSYSYKIISKNYCDQKMANLSGSRVDWLIWKNRPYCLIVLPFFDCSNL